MLRQKHAVREIVWPLSWSNSWSDTVCYFPRSLDICWVLWRCFVTAIHLHAIATSIGWTDVHLRLETLKDGPNLIVNSPFMPNFEFNYSQFFPVDFFFSFLYFLLLFWFSFVWFYSVCFYFVIVVILFCSFPTQLKHGHCYTF